jgi:hypothetical protein
MRFGQQVTSLLAAGLLCGAGLCHAGFELMQIEQIIGGVDGDPTAQAIQLRMRASNQGQVDLARLVAYDAKGSNAVTVVDFPDDVANASLGDRVLIVTANLLDYSQPVVSPDYFMTPIPTNYLKAGRLTYQSDLGVIY